MGQQQLLLIVLGVIVVGIAIVVGINLFNANAISANRDGIISDLNNLGAMAQQYYRKPLGMGGGGTSFTGTPPGWTIPTGLDSTANGTYSSSAIAQTVTIIGTGTEKANGLPVRLTATITSNNINILQNN